MGVIQKLRSFYPTVTTAMPTTLTLAPQPEVVENHRLREREGSVSQPQTPRTPVSYIDSCAACEQNDHYHLSFPIQISPVVQQFSPKIVSPPPNHTPHNLHASSNSKSHDLEDTVSKNSGQQYKHTCSLIFHLEASS